MREENTGALGFISLMHFSKYIGARNQACRKKVLQTILPPLLFGNKVHQQEAEWSSLARKRSKKEKSYRLHRKGRF